MSRLDKILRWLRVASMWALVIMMAVTIVDVAMRTILNELVLGSVELVQLALMFVVFLALPETFRRDQQITVDVIDQFASAKTTRLLRRTAAIVTIALLVVLAWRTVPPALDTVEYGDMTSDLRIPLIWYWLPLVVGAVAAAITAVLHELARRRGLKDDDA